MMKQLNIKYSYLSIALLVILALASCDQKADPAASISTDDYPKVDITHDFDQETYTEGDTVNFEITMDKPADQSFPFKLMVEGGDATDADLAGNSVTYPANKVDTVEINAVFKQDHVPEKDESFSWELGIDDIGVRKLINPDSNFPSGEATIKNKNNPNSLTVAYDWENSDNNFDFTAPVYQGGSYLGFLEPEGGSEKPLPIVADPGLGGTFYYSVAPGEENTDVTNYKLSVGYQDQSVEFYEGSVAFSDSADYEMEPSVTDTTAIRLLKVEATPDGNGGIDYDVENLNQSDSGS